jgi:predicted AAA+ superfamily ATPase
MTENNIEMIYDISSGRVREVDCAFHRYLYSQIDWDSRLIALDGPRGVGKTTMFLQHLKENPKESEAALYVSLDNIWLDVKDIYELVQPVCGKMMADILFHENPARICNNQPVKMAAPVPFI